MSYILSPFRSLVDQSGPIHEHRGDAPPPRIPFVISDTPPHLEVEDGSDVGEFNVCGRVVPVVMEHSPGSRAPAVRKGSLVRRAAGSA